MFKHFQRIVIFLLAIGLVVDSNLTSPFYPSPKNYSQDTAPFTTSALEATLVTFPQILRSHPLVGKLYNWIKDHLKKPGPLSLIQKSVQRFLRSKPIRQLTGPAGEIFGPIYMDSEDPPSGGVPVKEIISEQDFLDRILRPIQLADQAQDFRAVLRLHGHLSFLAFIKDGARERWGQTTFAAEALGRITSDTGVSSDQIWQRLNEDSFSRLAEALLPMYVRAEAIVKADQQRVHATLLQEWLGQPSRELSPELTRLAENPRDYPGPSFHIAWLAMMLRLVRENPIAQKLGVTPENILRGNMLNVGEANEPDNLTTSLRSLNAHALGLSPDFLYDDMAKGFILGVVEDMHQFPDDSFDSIVSNALFEPAYMQGIQMARHVRREQPVSRQEILEWCHSAALEIQRVLKDGGTFLLDTLKPNNNLLIATDEAVMEIQKVGMQVIQLGSTGEYLLINHKATPRDADHSAPKREIQAAVQNAQPLVLGVNVDQIPAVKNGLVAPEQAAYWIAHKQIINPDDQPLHGVHGAAGPSFADVLLAFNPTHVFNADRAINLQEFHDALEEWGAYGKKEDRHLPGPDKEIWYALSRALDGKLKNYYWHIDSVMRHFERLLVLELKRLGVPKDLIHAELDSDGNVVVSFPWSYPGSKDSVTRTFIFSREDLSNPASYSAPFNKILDQGPDFYFQKSAMGLMSSATQFLPRIARAVRRVLLIGPITAEEAPNGYDTVHRRINIKEALSLALDTFFSNQPGINRVYEDIFPNKSLSWRYMWEVELWINQPITKSPAKDFPLLLHAA